MPGERLDAAEFVRARNQYPLAERLDLSVVLAVRHQWARIVHVCPLPDQSGKGRKGLDGQDMTATALSLSSRLTRNVRFVTVGSMGKRVLVVDDNKDQVDTLRMLLGLRGYVTEGHYNAQTIVACVREFDPDVVILDLSMPIKDGLAAAREIRVAIPGKRPRLIALTAERRRPPGQDFDDYLTKPCDPDVLVDLIESGQ